MSPLSSLKRSLKHGVIRAGLEATALPFVRRLAPRAGGRGVIFTLHHVRPARKSGFQPNTLLSVTPEFLEQAIEVALAGKLVPVHLHDLPALFADPGERRSFVAWTLDDGYRNNAEHAAPLFRRFGIPYTIFVNPGFVERTRTMWWETASALASRLSSFEFDFGRGVETVSCNAPAEKLAAFHRLSAFVEATEEDEAVRRLDALAHSRRIAPTAIVEELVMGQGELKALAADPLVHFGAHTVNHINMRRVGAERLAREIEGSIEKIADYVGTRPRSFSYPYGGTDAVGTQAPAMVARAGISVAVTTQPGVLSAGRMEKPMELPRVSLNGLFQKRRYVEALVSGVPFKLMGRSS